MFHIELVKIAELQIEQGDLFKAKQSLTKALQCNPNYSWGNLRMANLLLNENRVEYAEKHLANILKADIDQDKNLKDAINVLQGNICRFKGEYKQAIYYYDQAICFSTNIQILKSALQKQLKILTSVPYPDVENLINKYFYIDKEITTYLIVFFYQICIKYNLNKYLELINNEYIYFSYDLLKYKINRLLVSGNFKGAYDVVSNIDFKRQDAKYQILVYYAEINEFLGNILLSIKCINQALSIKYSTTLEIKKILLLAEQNFDLAAKNLNKLLLEKFSRFSTEDLQLLLNNIKYKGSQLFECVLENHQISNDALITNNTLNILDVKDKTIISVIKQFLDEINNNSLSLSFIFDFLKKTDINNLLKREVLIQIHNSTFNDIKHYSLFVNHLNQYLSNSDLYYTKLICKQYIKNDNALNNSFIIILNSSNIGDTILYLYSLFEQCTLSNKQIILITCFENKDIISLVQGDWIRSIIFLAKQDIIEHYCPYQEVRPVLLGSIIYLSQGGKDRLKVSTEDGVWSGNFLNFRRLNVLDYYLRISHKDNTIFSSLSIYQNFCNLIKTNASLISRKKNLVQNIVVVAPIANSLGYYYNLSEMTNLWISIVNHLRTAGFIVRLVKSNREFCKETEDLTECIVNYFGDYYHVSEIDMSLIDFTKYMENINYFIGVRSGICDLINFIDNINQKNVCIYPPKVDYCFGLSNWIETKFIEYQLPENYINQTQENAQKICSLLDIYV